MDRAPELQSLLETRGLAVHRIVGRWLKVGFQAQCVIIAVFCAAMILTMSSVEGSLTMSGRDVGLLEHPTIWALLLLQAALPIVVGHTLERLDNIALKMDVWTIPPKTRESQISDGVKRFMALSDPIPRACASIVYSVGIAAFLWNTYQNQLPGVLLPFDFWDSTTFPISYWLTRPYKLYLLVWLVPYLALVQVAVVVTLLRVVREARQSGKLRIEPFHQDGVGGLGLIPGVVTTPILTALAIALVPLVGAFVVHQHADVTPMLGLAVVGWTAILAYLLPIAYLRTDIRALKERELTRITSKQQALHQTTLDVATVDPERIREVGEAIDQLEKASGRVHRISNYPHFVRIATAVGVVLSPTAIGVVEKLYAAVIPVFQEYLNKQP